jgi:hypothetical protein
MPSLTFRKFTPQDTQQIVRFLNGIFRVKITVEEWKWLVYENPDGSSRVYLALKNGEEIAGVCGFFPVLIYINGKLMRGGYGHHLSLAPEFRDTVSYIQFSMYQLEQEIASGTEYFIGPPNNSAYKPHKVLMNWQDFGYLDYLYKLNPKPQDHNCLKVDYLNDEFDFFYKEVTSNFKFYFSYSTERMNWRFFKKPGNPYQTYVYYDNGRFEGYVVLKRWKESDGRYTMHIIDIHSLTDSALFNLLSVAENESSDCYKIDLWAVKGYPYKNKIEVMGFVSDLSDRRPLAFRLTDGSKMTFPDGPASFMFGDGDQY